MINVAAVTRSRRRLLRQLYHVTNTVRRNIDLTSLIDCQFDLENSPPISPGEDEFLNSTSLLDGRRFEEATLPIPSISHHDASILPSKPPSTSTEHPRQSQSNSGADGLAAEAALTSSTAVEKAMATTSLESPPYPLSNASKDVAAIQVQLRHKTNLTESVAMPLREAAPSTAEGVAEISSPIKESVDLGTSHSPPRVLHLPSQDVQEECLHGRRDGEEENGQKVEAEKAARTARVQGQHEVPSSPSSTVGPYSAATPMPPQDSPDTSPNSDIAEVEVPTPKDLRPSPEEQRAKEEHDRILAARKEIARQQALGDEATPDDQLKWEEREAAARDAEEKSARESINGPEADAGNNLKQTEAEQVVEDMRDDDTRVQVVRGPNLDDQAAPDPVVPASESQPNATEDDGDNITVKPRVMVPPIETVVQQLQAPSPKSPRLVKRTSPDAVRRRSPSGISIEHLQSESSHVQLSKQFDSPEAGHTLPARPGQHSPAANPIHPQSLREALASPSHHTPDPNMLLVADLSSLKGAAEDPNRDYLEPLFRIQAHDSPSSNTRPLPDLVRNAAKCLSTEDQYTAIYERMDYRLLKRIYQLQNANKWSLRQMAKAKEPEQPKTHIDYMMDEMRWMRKDFKAERKMKRSICAWLAARCAEWVAADPEGRQAMQAKFKRPKKKAKAKSRSTVEDEQLPGMEVGAESAPEDELLPATPKDGTEFLPGIVVEPELKNVVCSLQKSGTLKKALKELPIVGFSDPPSRHHRPAPLNAVSKFVEGKIYPNAIGRVCKRSRFEYDDDAVLLESQPSSKRFCDSRLLAAESQDVALFHPDNKHIRDRLYANNAFRPPSEFPMPSIAFYEYRNGSQWIWEDDQKLRKLAKEYSFNWSLIADEMTLPSRYKSASERRTPWECFERWVELETLPAEMRKTVYFRTWFQRLEQSQQAAERRYQAAVAAMQAQAQQNGQQVQVPQRKRTIPSRVEKRKNSRYLWLVDAMRKNARKRENNAYKQAEAQRAAAQRKSQAENGTQQQTRIPTPQEMSRKRHEHDLQLQAAQAAHRRKVLEAQQRQLQMARAAQQNAQNGQVVQQRSGGINVPQGQQQMQVNNQQNVNMNGQLPQPNRPALPMATRNGHLAVPQVNAQGIPQAQMRPTGQMTHHNMQRIAHANAQQMGQQYGNQQYQMPNGGIPSPGNAMTTQQHLQNNQQLLAQVQQQVNGSISGQGTPPMARPHQMSTSPSMPPPPTPHTQPQQPGQLSSGHTPRLIQIKESLRKQHPHLTEDQLNQAATSALQEHSQAQSSNLAARQNAMNAAAGIQPQLGSGNNMPVYGHNQTAFQRNQMMNGNTQYMNAENASGQSPGMNAPASSSQNATAYSNQLRARQFMQMQMQHQSPNMTHAQLSGSPGMTHGSPSVAPASPSMQFSNMGQVPSGIGGGRPPSRSATPQMQRISSSNSVPGVGIGGMQSPGAMPQGSPRNMQANMAR
ncbi:hypothetical protein M433DRAFT_57 [Acidomyces richmondensis BFW]|nr:hypothetical protein M433DRAFT_57 [Acidomyces richmondensis BFW]